MPLFLLLLKWMAILSQFLWVFSYSYRNKNKGDRDNQINFSLQNINAGNEMKAWKSLTPHNIYKSYPSKVSAVPDSMKFLAARYLNISLVRHYLELFKWLYFYHAEVLFCSLLGAVEWLERSSNATKFDLPPAPRIPCTSTFLKKEKCSSLKTAIRQSGENI